MIVWRTRRPPVPQAFSMGEWGSIDNLLGQQRRFIEDGEGEMKQVQPFLIAFFQKETVKGSRCFILADTPLGFPFKKGLHETWKWLDEGMRKERSIPGPNAFIRLKPFEFPEQSFPVSNIGYVH